MSWSDRVRMIAAMAAVAALGGCFQPLYGEAAHPGLTQAMREVEVAPIPDRIGHYLGDDLISKMNGSGETPKPKYRLIVRLNQTTQAPTVQSQIGIADAATLATTENFDLVTIEGEKTLYNGSATAAATYDRTMQSFANLRAARDAEIRVARSLADEISLRVAAVLGQNP